MINYHSEKHFVVNHATLLHMHKAGGGKVATKQNGIYHFKNSIGKKNDHNRRDRQYRCISFIGKIGPYNRSARSCGWRLCAFGPGDQLRNEKNSAERSFQFHFIISILLNLPRSHLLLSAISSPRLW